MPKSFAARAESTIRMLPLCGEHCRLWTIRLLFVFLLVYPFHEYYQYAWDFSQWDALLFTGVLALILGLRIVATIPHRLKVTLSRLASRRAFSFGSQSIDGFFADLERRADDWAAVTAVFCAIAMALAFAYTLYPEYALSQVALAIAETVGAYIAGTYLGRLACYGQLGWGALRKQTFTVDVAPMHVDGVGGLKPVGEYFFFQAMVAAIPAVFLGVWILLFPIWPREYVWQEAYFGLLACAIAIEILAFIVPLWAFHRIMLQQKADWLTKADAIGNEITSLQEALSERTTTDEERKKFEQQIEQLRTQYWGIENMPTWPVDIRTRRRFQLNNVLLILPLVFDVANRSDWSAILDVLENFAS